MKQLIPTKRRTNNFCFRTKKKEISCDFKMTPNILVSKATLLSGWSLFVCIFLRCVCTRLLMISTRCFTRCRPFIIYFQHSWSEIFQKLKPDLQSSLSFYFKWLISNKRIIFSLQSYILKYFLFIFIYLLAFWKLFP